MKEFLLTCAGIIIAAIIINSFVIGGSGTDTIQGQGSRIGTKAITDLKTNVP